MRDVVKRIAATVVTAVLGPAVVLWTMLQLFNVPTAVLAALVWMLGAMGWRYATRRPVSGLLLLSLGILTVRTAFTLATGNAFVYFVQPVFADVAVAFVFLGSLGTSRPVIARLAPDFYPMSAQAAALPRMRRLFHRLTLMWGVVILMKAAVTWWLLETLATTDFVLIKGGAVMTLTATSAAVTIGWSYAVARREGVACRVQ